MVPFGPVKNDHTIVSPYAYPVDAHVSNDTDLPIAVRAIRATTDGNIAVVSPGFPDYPGYDAVEERMPSVVLPILAGETIELSVLRILASGTTATGLVGYT